MLLRLLGLAARQEPALACTALMAAGRLCDFESPCRNETLAAMAAVAEACEEEMRTEVIRALTKIAVFTSETEHSAMDVALTLVEAAAQHNNSPPTLISCQLYCITGICSWLPAGLCPTTGVQTPHGNIALWGWCRWSLT